MPARITDLPVARAVFRNDPRKMQELAKVHVWKQLPDPGGVLHYLIVSKGLHDLLDQHEYLGNPVFLVYLNASGGAEAEGHCCKLVKLFKDDSIRRSVVVVQDNQLLKDFFRA